jgi:hypothetical protein
MNAVPEWNPEEQWRVSSSPMQVLRARNGELDEALYGVRGAVRLSNGQYVVANGGNHELRWYDAGGRFLQRVGREGGGPSEFRSLTGVAHLGADSLLAWDRRNRRVSIFTFQGVYLGSLPMELSGRVQGVFSDGSLLVGETVGSDDNGFVRNQIVARRFHPLTGKTDSLGVYAGDEQIVQIQVDGSTVRVRGLQAPFGRAGVFTVRDRAYLVSSQDRFEIQVHEDNRLRFILRVDRNPERVTAEDIAAFQHNMLSWLDGPNVASFRRELQEIPYPEVFPAHGVIITDAAGRIWVQEYPKPWEPQVAWLVFDEELRLIAAVTLPAELQVYEIGEAYVLGRWRDDLDVEHVGTYALLKP